MTDSGVVFMIPATVAERLVVPTATPLTRPPPLTVATEGAELVHVETELPWASIVLQLVVDPSE
jgi:hypothetical protein